MNGLAATAGLAFGAAAVGGLAAARIVRARNMHLWLGEYMRTSSQRRDRAPGEPVDVFIAVCDHYEPQWGGASKSQAIARVDRWRTEYPRLFSQFHDSSGRCPQHTYFFPEDEYAPEYLDRLAELCRDGFGEVDVHLHHDHDTEEHLRETLERYRETLFHRHGLLRRDPVTGEIVYGFIHGNWALCNSRPDGRWCGVDNEITILRETGCYADFTMPSAPSDTQTSTINSIYYAHQHSGPKSHDCGIPATVGKTAPQDGLLMIQGPLLLDWTRRRFGLIPGIENGDLHGDRVASGRRMQLWMRAGVHVAGRPDWRFIKLHTHGAKEANANGLLSEAMQSFHAGLADQAKRDPGFRYHYVTAWEMAQLVHRAEQGLRDVRFGETVVSGCSDVLQLA